LDLYLSRKRFSYPSPSSKCPHCGFEKIYKNGTYKIKPERFFELLKKDKEIEITVQQFICLYYKSSVYIFFYPREKEKNNSF